MGTANLPVAFAAMLTGPPGWPSEPEQVVLSPHSEPTRRFSKA